ncbi:VOC family protein [Actinokineospora sp. UTMC 2448]|uniref:bleomycin resistance protein n=1 Tax=Actinokineospora sp. UTMC 2448 TaxID=2268449 RepID=UPI0021647BA7|nr:VOC family protein [Actinokineospora sp. UTMC 2448]UVS77761.1 Bleomycin resistance protein [Actinokineospora sp. UTMC 2448]
MADEKTIPLLPCPSIDETEDFYRALGFTQTYRQTKPNPYLCVRREDLELHFFGMDPFDPADSYGSCLVIVPDTGALFAEFAAGLRERYGKLPLAGIPRITRPRKRKNQDNLSGFTVVDPGGNWLRIFPAKPGPAGAEASSPLAKALANAVVQGESRGETAQAIRILDTNLAKAGPDDDRAEALLYRAELALRVQDHDRAREIVAELTGMGVEIPEELAEGCR